MWVLKRLVTLISKKQKFPRVELRIRGRAGCLMYLEEYRKAELELEMSGVKEFDFLVERHDLLRNWADGTTLTDDEWRTVTDDMKAFTEQSNYRFQWQVLLNDRDRSRKS